MSMDFQKYQVWVSCMTYDQSSYIEASMDGFCMQQTSFPFVCTIVDDASTDGEQEVIKKYMQEHFDLQDASVAYEKDTDYGHVTFAQHKINKNCYFAVILLKENHYSQKKSKVPYLTEWMDAKYIALCEGDDYWTDPLKLQKQVDFLEEHEDVWVCFHRVNVIVPNESKMIEDYHVIDVSGESSIFDLAKIGNYIPTNSAMYRNDSRIYADRNKVGSTPIGDYTLWMMCAQYGKIYKLSDNMAVYRYGVGSWQSKPKIYQYINILNLLNRLRMVVHDVQIVNVLDDRIKDLTSQIINMERKDKEQLKMIKESRTYRLGSFMAKPMIWVRKIFKG